MKLLELIKKQFELRIFEESIPRINKVLDILTEDQLWYTPNKHVNSIGNLILHLCGNVTQWIGSGLGGLPDNRERSLEFSRSGHQNKKELSESLDQLIKLTRPIIQELSMDQLEEAKNVQERLAKLLIALGNEFDGKIEGINFQESAIGVSAKYDTSFTPEIYVEALKTNME